MASQRGYFTYGFYGVAIGLVGCVTSMITIVFIVLGVSGLTGDIVLASFTFGLGCVFGLIFAYLPILEFWRRARPIRIDERGVTTHFLRRELQFLAWSEMVQIVKTQFVHPLGYSGEIVWFRRAREQNVTHPSDDGRLTQSTEETNVWRSQFALFPDPGTWMCSTMGTGKFREACNLATRYAHQHKIPMESCDIRPEALQRVKRSLSPEAFGRARRRGVVQPIDHL
jgi:hypothetical protein